MEYQVRVARGLTQLPVIGACGQLARSPPRQSVLAGFETAVTIDRFTIEDCYRHDKNDLGCQLPQAIL